MKDEEDVTGWLREEWPSRERQRRQQRLGVERGQCVGGTAWLEHRVKGRLVFGVHHSSK